MVIVKRREVKYYLAIVLAVLIYLAVNSVYPDKSGLATVITTTTALIAAVAFWLQMKRSKDMEEATFIMEMNNNFISNDKLTRIEHELEKYYAQVINKKDNPELNLDLDIESKDRQQLVNYLVYMEGLAALVEKGVLRLGVIDDLFAYRFFIAVNNPIVQKTELLPYANYYQGCFKLSEMWTKRFDKEKREIPLEKHSLYKCRTIEKF